MPRHAEEAGRARGGLSPRPRGAPRPGSEVLRFGDEALRHLGLLRFQQALGVLERIGSSSARFDRELAQLESQFDLAPVNDSVAELENEEVLQDE